MKQGQFTNQQIVAILQEADRGEKPFSQICKEKGISDATFYTCYAACKGSFSSPNID